MSLGWGGAAQVHRPLFSFGVFQLLLKSLLDGVPRVDSRAPAGFGVVDILDADLGGGRLADGVLRREPHPLPVFLVEEGRHRVNRLHRHDDDEEQGGKQCRQIVAELFQKTSHNLSFHDGYFN